MFHQHDLEGPDRQPGRQRQINERHNGGLEGIVQLRLSRLEICIFIRARCGLSG